jgi:hypothetical protein
LAGLLGNSHQGKEDGPRLYSIGPTKDSIPTWQVPCGVLCAFIAVFAMGRWGDRPIVELLAFLLVLVAGFLILVGYVDSSQQDDDYGKDILPREYPLPHNSNIVPVKEVFNGQTVWDGIVEVFDLHGHLKANKAYAWSHATDDPDKPTRHVTVLHAPPAVSPETAVRAAILQEFKNLGTAEEN